MKQKIAAFLAAALLLGLVGCAGAPAQSGAADSAAQSSAASSAGSAAQSTAEQETAQNAFANAPVATFRIAGLKGPTTMGLVNLIAKAENGEAHQDYQFTMHGAADEIVPLLVQGKIDVAAIPANLAATLYQKTDGAIQAVAINTLGVLYAVETGDTVHSVQDLKGRTILSTGKGTTPEYVLRYLLRQNGLDPDSDVTVEYYSEATEVSAQLAVQADAVAILPQPYVSAVQVSAAKDSSVPQIRVALNLTEEWNKVSDHDLVTGVTVIRREFAEQNPEAMQEFLYDYENSVNAANTELEGTAALCEKYEVVAKAAIAQKALPQCNIVFLTGDELRQNLSEYLQVLYDADPASVGGSLPDEAFYFVQP